MTVFLKLRTQARALGLSAILLSVPVTATANQDVISVLLDLDLEQLLQIEVTTAARKAQTLSRTAAAAYVISRDDMRRAGVTSLPEALRLAPGVQVGQINPSQWSATIRGFGGRFASKLLVLVDGRSIYAPVYAGVYWEMHSPPLDEIERIEVIRGPGATLWGANAVNGVINIITRHSQDSEGNEVQVLMGDQQQSLNARHGVKLNDDAGYRVYADAEHQDRFQGLQGEDLDNGFERYRLGLRSDWYGKENTDHFSVHAEGIQMRQGQTAKIPDMSAPGLSRIRHQDNHISGAYALGRWEHSLAVDTEFSLQGYVEYHDRDAFEFDESRFTAALDFQYRMALGRQHDFMWGASYRHTRDSVRSQVGRLRVPRKTLNFVSAFVQDEYEVIPERLWLTAGFKIEDNEYTDGEWQPNVRLLWTPAGKHTLWASVARAVRMPSRTEIDTEMTHLQGQFMEIPNQPVAVPTLFAFSSSGPAFDSEEVIAYEAGYRAQFNDRLSLDLALFYNDYQQLRDGTPRQPIPQAAGYILVPMRVVNNIEGHSHGTEIAFDWRPGNDWRWQFTYSWMGFDLRADLPPYPPLDFYEQGDPQQQLSLRAGRRINEAWTVDAWLRWVDEAPFSGAMGGYVGGVDSYTTLDLRLAWLPRENLEVALLGKNLLEAGHQEAIDDLFAVPNEVPRSVALSLRWRF